jgi:hypothetical protein
MKKRAAKQKARQAAKALQKQQQAAKRKGQQRRKHKKGDAEQDAVPAAAEVAAVAGETPAVAVTSISTVAAATPIVPPPAEPTEEKADETETASNMLDILSSVFMNDEANSRHEVLLRGVDVSSTEELLAFARKNCAKSFSPRRTSRRPTLFQRRKRLPTTRLKPGGFALSCPMIRR